MFAAGNGHVEMTRLLLARGATVDHRDHNGDRALLWAARARSCRDRADVAGGRRRGAVGRRSLSQHAADARLPATRGSRSSACCSQPAPMPRRRDHTDDTALHARRDLGQCRDHRHAACGRRRSRCRPDSAQLTPLHHAANYRPAGCGAAARRRPEPILNARDYLGQNAALARGLARQRRGARCLACGRRRS